MLLYKLKNQRCACRTQDQKLDAETECAQQKKKAKHIFCCAMDSRNVLGESETVKKCSHHYKQKDSKSLANPLTSCAKKQETNVRICS